MKEIIRPLGKMLTRREESQNKKKKTNQILFQTEIEEELQKVTKRGPKRRVAGRSERNRPQWGDGETATSKACCLRAGQPCLRRRSQLSQASNPAAGLAV